MSQGKLALFAMTANHRFALPIADVVAVMRPLPIQRLAGPSRTVLGLSVVGGEPVPVISMAALLTGEPAAPGRFIVIRAGARRAVLAVDAVQGTYSIEGHTFAALPPLLAADNPHFAGTLTSQDPELATVLATATLVPDAAWQAAQAGGGAA